MGFGDLARCFTELSALGFVRCFLVVSRGRRGLGRGRRVCDPRITSRDGHLLSAGPVTGGETAASTAARCPSLLRWLSLSHPVVSSGNLPPGGVRGARQPAGTPRHGQGPLAASPPGGVPFRPRRLSDCPFLSVGCSASPRQDGRGWGLGRPLRSHGSWPLRGTRRRHSPCGY